MRNLYASHRFRGKRAGRAGEGRLLYCSALSRLEQAMSSVVLTRDNFESVVSGNDMVIVDFWAPWCGPCRAFAPTFEASSERHADVVFAKVNTEEEPELAGAFNIRSIPTLMFFREKVILYSEAGAPPAPGLEQVIAQAKAVNMAEVHEEIALRGDGKRAG
jgi:thioredoxin 1